jgi:hypothetical protein
VAAVRIEMQAMYSAVSGEVCADRFGSGGILHAISSFWAEAYTNAMRHDVAG